MALLKVLHYPDERLRKVATPIERDEFTPELQITIDNMFETMEAENGIGLAATQVDIHKRLIVIDIDPEAHQPLVLINPQILSKNGKQIYEEGCLSIPNTHAKVTRAETITIQAWDRHGETFTKEASELLAICIQHEIDHLNGKLFVDHLSPLKRDRIRKKLEKEHRVATRRG